MEIFIEEIEKKDGFITVLDEEGMVTIQMSENSINKIINVFDKFINTRTEHKAILEVIEFNTTFKLNFSLKNEDDGFHLTCFRVDTSNFYNDFELEFCDLTTWEKIKKLHANDTANSI